MNDITKTYKNRLGKIDIEWIASVLAELKNATITVKWYYSKNAVQMGKHIFKAFIVGGMYKMIALNWCHLEDV